MEQFKRDDAIHEMDCETIWARANWRKLNWTNVVHVAYGGFGHISFGFVFSILHPKIYTTTKLSGKNLVFAIHNSFTAS